jgi:beta-galactosidase
VTVARTIELDAPASNAITFEVGGPGEIVATDNGDPTDRQVFPSAQRDAYSGMALAIIRSLPNQSGSIEVTASAAGLAGGSVTIETD